MNWKCGARLSACQRFQKPTDLSPTTAITQIKNIHTVLIYPFPTKSYQILFIFLQITHILPFLHHPRPGRNSLPGATYSLTGLSPFIVYYMAELIFLKYNLHIKFPACGFFSARINQTSPPASSGPLQLYCSLVSLLSHVPHCLLSLPPDRGGLSLLLSCLECFPSILTQSSLVSEAKVSLKVKLFPTYSL